MEYKPKRTKDIGIELARIIACFIVIGVHVALNDMESGTYSLSRGLINCFFADGVSVFWLITGCFLFKTKKYYKLLVGTAKKIAFPIAMLQVFCLHFSAFLECGGDFVKSLNYAFGIYGSKLKDALSLQPTIPATGHLWYCYTYIIVMLAFPLISAFVSWVDKKDIREKVFCIVTLIILAVNDVSFNGLLHFSNQGLNAFIPAVVQIIWGHIIYKNKEKLYKLQNKKILVLFCGIGMGVLNFIRMYIVNVTGDKSIMYWYTLIGLLCSISILVVCMIMSGKVTAKGQVHDIILELASHTFEIYLIHILIRMILSKFGLNHILFKITSSIRMKFVGELIYTVLFIICVFGISLCIIKITHLVIKRIPRGQRKLQTDKH